ncbi:MAG: glycosyltransferase, partial [Bdellovibrionota bacterium]
GLFLGDGPQNYVEEIRNSEGCQVLPFVAVQDLAQYYQAADIGVWPKQESTSQLDAIACGLPIILSNRVHVTDRVEGNGSLYVEGNPQSLASELLKLDDPRSREAMGRIGAAKIRARYSWIDIAKKYTDDYEAALRGRARG